jgi:hypothetical protein
MADGNQNFQVKITTTADTAGAEKEAAALKAVEAQAEKTNVAIAEQLAAAGAKFDPKTQSFVSLAAPTKLVTPETEAAADAAGRIGINLNKARGEALVLARELATGGNYARTMGSLLGALGLPITIAGIAAFSLFEHFKKAAEEARKLTLETAKFERELENTEEGYRKINTAAKWDENTKKIQDRIAALREEREATTDDAKIAQLDQEISREEISLGILNLRASKALETADAERKVKEEIAEQVHGLELQDRAEERLRSAIEKRLQLETSLAEIELHITDLKIDQAVDTGEITQTEGVMQKIQAKAEAEEANFKREQAASNAKIESIKREASAADASLKTEKDELDALEKRNRADQATKGATAKQLEQYKDLSSAARTAAEEADNAEAVRKATAQQQDASPITLRLATEEAAEKRKAADAAANAAAKAASDIAKANKAAKEAAEDQKKLTPEIEEQTARVRAEEARMARARAASETIPDIETEEKSRQRKFDARKRERDLEGAKALEKSADEADAVAAANDAAIAENERSAKQALLKGDTIGAKKFRDTARDLRENAPPTGEDVRDQADRLRREAERPPSQPQASADKLSSAADKLSSAADKLTGTKPPEDSGTVSAIKDNTVWLQKIYQQWA